MRPSSAGAQAVGRLRDYLNSVRERCTGCEALLVLDARGRAVASSAGRTAGMQLTLERLNGLQTGDALVGEAYWDAGIRKHVDRPAGRRLEGDGPVVNEPNLEVPDDPSRQPQLVHAVTTHVELAC